MVEFSSLTHLHFGALELDKQIGDNNYNGVNYYICKYGCKILVLKLKNYNLLLLSVGLNYEYLYLDKALVCGHTPKKIR